MFTLLGVEYKNSKNFEDYTHVKVSDVSDFSCTILDTDDNSVDKINKKQLLQLYAKYPYMWIVGVRDNTGIKKPDEIHQVVDIENIVDFDYKQSSIYTVAVKYSKEGNGINTHVTLYKQGYSDYVIQFYLPLLLYTKPLLRSVKCAGRYVEIAFEYNNKVFIYEVGHDEKNRGQLTFSPYREEFGSENGMIRSVDSAMLTSLIEKWRDMHNNLFPDKPEGIKSILFRAPVGTEITVKYITSDQSSGRKRSGQGSIVKASGDNKWTCRAEGYAFSGDIGGAQFAVHVLDSLCCYTDEFKISVRIV